MVLALLEEIAGTLIWDLTRVNAFDSCCKGFTRTDTCGMKGEVTGARILLSLFPFSPDTGNGSHYPDRTSIGRLLQRPLKRVSRRVTLLHTEDLTLP